MQIIARAFKTSLGSRPLVERIKYYRVH